MGTDIETRCAKLHEKAITLYGKGKRDEALKVSEKLLSTARMHLGERHPGLEPALSLLGELRQACGDPEQAERLFREVVEIRRFYLGAKDPGLVGVLHRLAEINLSLERFTIAEPLVRESIEICRALPEESRLAIALPLQSLARIHFAADRWTEAEEAVREAIAATSLGETTPQTRNIRADCLAQLAALLEAFLDFEGAVESIREALAIKSELFGQGHGEVLNLQTQLARVLDRLGDFDESDALASRCAEAIRAGSGEFSDIMVTALESLAATRESAGHRDESLRLVSLADMIHDHVIDGFQLALWARRTNRAAAHAGRGEYLTALRMVEPLITELESAGPTFRGLLFSASQMATLANLQLARGRDALRHAERCRLLSKDLEGTSPELRWMSEMCVASAHAYLDDFATATELLRVANLTQPDNPTLLTALTGSEHELGDVDAAERHATELMARCVALHGEASLQMVEAHAALGYLATDRGRFDDAIEHFAKAIELAGRAIGVRQLGAVADGIAPIFDMRATLEAMAWLATRRSGPDNGCVHQIAVAAGRQIRAVGHSDLHLASIESPTEADSLRPARRTARRVALLHDAGDPDTAAHVRVRLDAATAQLDEALAAARAAAPALDALRRAWDGNLGDVFTQLGVADRFVLLLRTIQPRFSEPDLAERRKLRSAPRVRIIAARIDRSGGTAIDLGAAPEIEALVDRYAQGDDAAMRELSARLGPAFGSSPRGTLVIAAESVLVELPFELVETDGDGGRCTLASQSRVVMAPSLGTVAGRRSAPIAAAADTPLWIESPSMPMAHAPAGAAGAVIEPKFSRPIHPTWWRALLRRMNMVSESGVPPRQIDLSIRLRGTVEASSELIEDRRRMASDSIVGSKLKATGSPVVVSGEDASIAALRGVRSPRWLHLNVPWALLPDQPYNAGEPGPIQWLHTLPALEMKERRPETDPTPCESPCCRGGLYLSSIPTGTKPPGMATDDGAERRFPGVLPIRAIAELDLAQTAAVVLATPPRRPHGGPVGMALNAFVDAFLCAGARCVILPRPWASQEAVDTFLAAFYKELIGAETLNAADAWHRAATALRTANAPPRTWAAMACFG